MILVLDWTTSNDFALEVSDPVYRNKENIQTWRRKQDKKMKVLAKAELNSNIGSNYI